MTEHQVDTPIVAAAREAEHRQTVVEEGVKAILGHTERMDAHLATLNGRTAKNESAIADVRALIVGHVDESINRNLYGKVDALQHDVGALLQAHSIEAAVAGERKKWFATVFSSLDRIGAKAVPYALVGLILKQLGIF